ncbi:aminodeoxychorismate lyase [Cytobacillus suaedae]|nr:aminodeoxychorismate lyase [Cytobacillus suaedae]
MYIYLNGEYVKQEEAKISPLDHGYLYGLGVFETFRTYDGHPFLLDDHLARLKEALKELQIDYSPTREDVKSIVDLLLKRNNLEDAYIRFNVSAGVGEVGLQVDVYKDPTVIVFIKPLPKLVEGIEKEAIILEQRRNSPEGATRLKSHHYLNNVIGKREAGGNPTVEGVFLTKEGYLAEGVTSNLFWVKNGKLFTPSVETGILDGVTRRFILELATHHGIKSEMGYYQSEEIEVCDEAFITNSVQEIVPLSKINNISLPGNKGIVTIQLQKLYAELRKRLWSRTGLREEVNEYEDY